MANVANKGTFATYSGANLNEIFYEPVFRSDDIMRNYRVLPNVKHKMNVFTSKALTKIVAKYTGCSATSGSTQFNIDEKTITAGRMRVALEQCTDEFFGTYIEEMYRNGVDVMNLEGTQLADAIVNRAVKGIAQDVVRLAWGDDTGSGVAGYGNMDGWMKLMGDDATVLAARTEFSAVAPTAPTAAEALSLIREMYDSAPAALQQVAAADKKIYVTPKTYNAYLQNLEGTSADLAITNQQDGVLVVKFRGVQLVPMYEWDTILADTDPALFLRGGVNGTEGACYCAVDNLIIGSDVTDPEGSFKVFYDDLEEKMFFRGYFKLGVQFLYPSLVQWGIFY
jgi:hypothetical protein|tara:strand:+ start:1450 stop:2463 length:1014 start_codon:yes stop_codon:yes gene_type:complete